MVGLLELGSCCPWAMAGVCQSFTKQGSGFRDAPRGNAPMRCTAPMPKETRSRKIINPFQQIILSKISHTSSAGDARHSRESIYDP